MKKTKHFDAIDLIEDKRQIKTWLSKDGLLKFTLIGFTKKGRCPVVILDLNRPYREFYKIFGLLSDTETE